MIHLKKIQSHEEKAKLNSVIADEFLKKGQPEKSDHFRRISDAHYRNAMYYRRYSQLASLAMAF